MQTALGLLGKLEFRAWLLVIRRHRITETTSKPVLPPSPRGDLVPHDTNHFDVAVILDNIVGISVWIELLDHSCAVLFRLVPDDHFFADRKHNFFLMDDWWVAGLVS